MDNNDFLNNLFGELFGGGDAAKGEATDGNDTNELDKAAVELKKFYDSFIRAGFTEAQTMKFICNMISIMLHK